MEYAEFKQANRIETFLKGGLKWISKTCEKYFKLLWTVKN
jgi:hypothetical protein